MATVLIIEDEPALLILAESVLKNAGYDTLTAGSLAEVRAPDGVVAAVDHATVIAVGREAGSRLTKSISPKHVISSVDGTIPVVIT